MLRSAETNVDSANDGYANDCPMEGIGLVQQEMSEAVDWRNDV